MNLKIVLPIREIPLGGRVKKLTGEKVYVLRNCVRVYDQDGSKQEILAAAGSVLLVPEDGSGNASSVGPDLEVIWLIDFDALCQLLSAPHK